MSIRSDYKPPANWRPQRQSVRRHGLLVVTLTLIGLFGSALAYIKQHNSQQQTSATPPAATPAAQPAKPPVAKAPATVVAAKAEVETPAPAIKPKYDFYNELPKRQIDVRRDHAKPSAVAARAAATQSGPEPSAKPGAQKKQAASSNLSSANPKESKATASKEGKMTASKESKAAASKKDARSANALATANSGNNKPAPSKQPAPKTDAANPTGRATANAPSRNPPRATATGTTAGVDKSGAAPIRHLTAPTAAGAKSARPIHNATTPTATNAVGGTKPTRAPTSAPASRPPQPSQSVNRNSSIAIKIE